MEIENIEQLFNVLSTIKVHQIIIYLRKSRNEEKEDLQVVLARHEKMLQDYAIRNFGERIPEENIFREVVSGETIDDRIEIKKVFNKLVRDKIPEKIKNNGEVPYTRVLNDEEFRIELEKKLLEECNEVLKAVSLDDRVEELADVLEVLCAIGALEGKDLDSIISVMKSKREKRGGFSQKIFFHQFLLIIL